MRVTVLALLAAATLAGAPQAQVPAEPDWKSVEAETLRHFQALVQFDTSDPPGNEKPAADYLKSVLEREGHRRSRCSRASPTGPTWSRGSRATAASGRFSSWATPTW